MNKFEHYFSDSGLYQSGYAFADCSDAYDDAAQSSCADP